MQSFYGDSIVRSALIGVNKRYPTSVSFVEQKTELSCSPVWPLVTYHIRFPSIENSPLKTQLVSSSSKYIPKWSASSETASRRWILNESDLTIHKGLPSKIEPKGSSLKTGQNSLKLASCSGDTGAGDLLSLAYIELSKASSFKRAVPNQRRHSESTVVKSYFRLVPSLRRIFFNFPMLCFSNP